MKFLIDSCLTKKLFIGAGHIAKHVNNIWPDRDPGDDKIISHARDNGYIIVTGDSDFEEREVGKYKKPHNGILQIEHALANKSTKEAALRLFEPLISYLSRRHIIHARSRCVEIKSPTPATRNPPPSRFLIDETLDIRTFDSQRVDVQQTNASDPADMLSQAQSDQRILMTRNPNVLEALKKHGTNHSGVFLLTPSRRVKGVINGVNQRKIELPGKGTLLIHGDDWPAFLADLQAKNEPKPEPASIQPLGKRARRKLRHMIPGTR